MGTNASSLTEAPRPFALPKPIEAFAGRTDNYNYDMLLGMDVMEGFDCRFLKAGYFEMDLR